MFRFLLGLLGATALLSAAELEVEMRREFAPNLLKNPGFEELDAKGNPAGWFFDNCSNSRYVLSGTGVENGNRFATVTLKERNSGYWTQRVPVQEGRRYCASVKFRADSQARPMLWIRTDQWQDGKSPQHEPLSSTEIYIVADPRHGAELRAELANFIDPALLDSVECDTWNRFGRELVIPAGHGVTSYLFKPGAFFGGMGTILADDGYFGLAENTLHVKCVNAVVASYRVLSPAGEVIVSGKFATDGTAAIKLPSLLIRYRLEITGTNGKVLAVKEIR